MKANQEHNNRPAKPRLLDQVREVLRTKHYSLRTEPTYVHLIRKLILYHDKPHPNQIAESEINQFLYYLAIKRNVAALPMQRNWARQIGL